jgi:hypothetical protein
MGFQLSHQFLLKVFDDITCDVAYVKEKEKQAQIVGPPTRRTNDRINLKLLKEIDVKVGNPSLIYTSDQCLL